MRCICLLYTSNPASIEQDQVDLIVKVDRVGDAAKIGAGATRMTTNPVSYTHLDVYKRQLIRWLKWHSAMRQVTTPQR